MNFFQSTLSYHVTSLKNAEIFVLRTKLICKIKMSKINISNFSPKPSIVIYLFNVGLANKNKVSNNELQYGSPADNLLRLSYTYCSFTRVKLNSKLPTKIKKQQLFLNWLNNLSTFYFLISNSISRSKIKVNKSLSFSEEI